MAALLIGVLCAILFGVASCAPGANSARIADAEARTTEGFARIEEAHQAQVEAQEETSRVRIEGQHEIDKIWADAGSNEMTQDGNVVRRLALADLLASEQWRAFAMITLFCAIVGSTTVSAYALARTKFEERKCDQCTYEGCDRSATYQAIQRARLAARTQTIVARRYPSSRPRCVGTDETRPLG
jgi:hypothetical protein